VSEAAFEVFELAPDPVDEAAVSEPGPRPEESGEDGASVVSRVDVTVAVVTLLMMVGALVMVRVKPGAIEATVLLVTEVTMR
jgi:hypothetical protein